MIVELAVAEPGAGPYGVAAGPDGALWVTLVHAGDLARVTTAVGEDGGLRHHDLPSSGSEPHGVTVGPDGGVRAALETGEVARV